MFDGILSRHSLHNQAMFRTLIPNLGIAGFSLGAVAVAVYLQGAWDLAPCTMCILQRYAFLAIGLGTIALDSTLSRWLSVSAAVVGILASLRIQWAISVPSVTCGRDKLATFLNDLPWIEKFPSFEVTGVCGDKVPPVMGIPFHVWSWMLFAGLLVIVWRYGPGSRFQKPICAVALKVAP